MVAVRFYILVVCMKVQQEERNANTINVPLITNSWVLKSMSFFYEPSDDFFFQAKKPCVLNFSINITCLNILCWSLWSKFSY